MIARTWRGVTKADDAETYRAYLEETGFREFRDTPGNRGALGLRRLVGDRAEWLLISFWDSPEAIRRFAGEDADRAVFFPEDERFLIERDLEVEHHEVVHHRAPGRHGGPA